MRAIVILVAVVATIFRRGNSLKLNRGNDAFSLQIEQKTVVGHYDSLNMVISNGKNDVFSMTPSQAGSIIESVEVKRLQISIDRWTIIASKMQNDLHTYSPSNQQIYHEMQINIAVSNVLLGYLHVLNESLIIGMGKLATSCPIIWNIGTHFNESIDASMSWLYCVIPYGSMNSTESIAVESIVDKRLPWIKYAYTNTNNYNSTVALLLEFLQVEPKLVNYIANETRNTWLFMLKLRLKLISYVLEMLESKSKNQKLKVYNSVQHAIDGDTSLYDNQVRDSMQNYGTSNINICNSTEYSNDASGSCSNSKFNDDMLELFMSSLADALKSEIQAETIYYLDFMNVTINQGISTIVDDYSHQQQIDSHTTAPMGFQSKVDVLAIFNELVIYWRSNQKKTHFTSTSRATGASASAGGDKSKNYKEANKDEPRGGDGVLLTSQLITVIIILASGGAFCKYLIIPRATAAPNSTSKSSGKSTKSVKSTNKVVEHKMKKKGNKGNHSPVKKNLSPVTSPRVDCAHSPPGSRESDTVKLVSSVSTDELQLYCSDNEEEWQVSSNKKKSKAVIQPRNGRSHDKFVKTKGEDSLKRYDTASRVSNEQQTKCITGRSTKDGSTLLKQALSIRPTSSTLSNKITVPQNAEKNSNNTVKHDFHNQVITNVDESTDGPDYTETVDARQYSNDTYPPTPAIIVPQYNPYYYYNNAMSSPLGPSTNPPMIFYNPYTEHLGQVLPVLPLSPPPIPVLPRSPGGNGYPMYNDVDILTLVRNQIEYYFSEENLSKDTYLKSLMDGDGYVNIGEIIKFRRINILLQCVGGSSRVVMDAVLTSEKLELSGLTTDNSMEEFSEIHILTHKIRSKIF